MFQILKVDLFFENKPTFRKKKIYFFCNAFPYSLGLSSATLSIMQFSFGTIHPIIIKEPVWKEVSHWQFLMFSFHKISHFQGLLKPNTLNILRKHFHNWMGLLYFCVFWIQADCWASDNCKRLRSKQRARVRPFSQSARQFLCCTLDPVLRSNSWSCILSSGFWKCLFIASPYVQRVALSYKCHHKVALH